FLHQLLEQGAMTPRGIHARRGTQQGDGFALRDQLGDAFNQLPRFFLPHLPEILLAILFPGNRVPVLAVKIGVQLLAWAKDGIPFVPGFVFLGQSARPITTDQHPKTVVGIRGLVPAFGLERHGESLLSSEWLMGERGRDVPPRASYPAPRRRRWA